MSDRNPEKFMLRIRREEGQIAFDGLCSNLCGYIKLVHKHSNKKEINTNILNYLAFKLQIPKTRMQFRYLDVEECEKVIVLLKNFQLEEFTA